MASLEMEGPYVLVPDRIDEQVTAKTAGNFALGYIAESDFVVLYVGRSDEDLNAVLKDWVFLKSDCLFFKYSTAKTAEEAFKKECINYHDFGASVNLKNEKHPERPACADWKCPGCVLYR
jgi:hypothetical protein